MAGVRRVTLDPGDAIGQLTPTSISGQATFGETEQVLRSVMSEARAAV